MFCPIPLCIYLLWAFLLLKNILALCNIFAHNAFSFAFKIIITMAQNILNKYIWLADTIFKALRLTLKDINDKWLGVVYLTA